jgi:hypothetical protein
MDPVTGGLAAGSTALGAFGAGKAADAAKDAAKLQAQSAERAANLQYQANQDALRFMQDEAAQVRADQAPQRALASGSISTLADLTGIPYDLKAASTPLAGTGQRASAALPPSVIPPSQSLAQHVRQGLDARIAANGPKPTMGGRVQGSMADLTAPPPAASQSSYVSMMAPNGEIQQVSADQVAHFEQLGARRV